MAYRKLTRYLAAPDGTRIAWHAHREQEGGAGYARRPTVLLTNGIGTTENFWRHLVADLETDHRVCHWDYRGHGLSGLSRDGRYDLGTLSADLARVTEAVMDEGDGRPPHHVAFSMGVAVLLELWRTRRDLVPSMTLVAGAPDAPFAPLLPEPLAPAWSAVRGALAAATPAVRVAAPLLRAAFGSGLMYPLGRLTGVLRAGAPREDVEQMMQSMKRMDALAYWRTLRGLAAARGSDVLPTVDVPVQILAAAKDAFMPFAQMERLHAALPEAEWIVLPEAGHAGLLEAGPEIAGHLRRFLAARRA